MIARAFYFARTPKNFVYALTLNSHLPLRNLDVSSETEEFCSKNNLRRPVCLLNDALAKTLHAIRLGALSARPDSLPLIVLVGDHAPPFSIKELRDSYSQSHVPAYVLSPWM